MQSGPILVYRNARDIDNPGDPLLSKASINAKSIVKVDVFADLGLLRESKPLHGDSFYGDSRKRTDCDDDVKGNSGDEG